MQCVRHLLKRKFFREMRVDIRFDAVGNRAAPIGSAVCGSSAVLLHQCEDGKQQVVRTVVVARGQLLIQHIV